MVKTYVLDLNSVESTRSTMCFILPGKHCTWVVRDLLFLSDKGVTLLTNLSIIASFKEPAAGMHDPGFKIYTLNEMLSGVILHACTVQ